MAESVTALISRVKDDVSLLTFTWEASAADGSLHPVDSPAVRGDVILVVTNPGTTAPTSNYDISLTDVDGVDVMGGTLANRHSSNSEQAKPLINNEACDRFVSGVLTLEVAGNSVKSAQGVVKVYIRK